MYLTLSEATVFNLSFETATQYNLCRFIDKSEDELTSDKLKLCVLYLETDEVRYEVARMLTEDFMPVYRVAVVKKPREKTIQWLKKNEIPLQVDHLDIEKENLSWSQFIWGANSVKII